MKIIAIRIKNLASLEGISEINFTKEPLSSAGIFAITGPTGAGKSTILDALCLALYGKTPRYLHAKEIGIEIHDVQGSTINQGDVRGILRDGTADGFAEVDFVGIDGLQYRANWSVRRARNKVEGNMQGDAISLKNITSNINIPGRKTETYKEIERLVGLNFEQFTRSVLLAQGDFTAFLKANKDEKSSLLEKLTGTHIYSQISKKIYENYKLEEQQLRDLYIRNEGISTLTDEELNILRQEQTNLNGRIKVLEMEIEALTKEINWHEQLTRLKDSQELADNALEQAVDAKTKAAQRKQKLNQAQRAQQTRTWADALKHVRKQQEEKEKALGSLEESSTELQQQMGKLQKELISRETDLSYKNRVLTDALPFLERAKKLDTLLFEKNEQLIISQKEAENSAEKSGQHQGRLVDRQKELDALSAEIKTLEDWKAEHNDRRPIADNKDVILSKLQDASKLLDTLQSSTKESNDLQNKIKTKEAEKTGLEPNLGTSQKEWDVLKKTYDARYKKLLLVPIETLSLDKNNADRELENTVQAQAHWKLLSSLLMDFDTLGQKQVKDRAEYRSKLKILQQVDQRLAIEKIQKETSGRLLQKARLAATENVETLRAGLIENEPCPVCGSESHPYTFHNLQLENVLVELEKEHLKTENKYLATFGQYSASEKECQTLKQMIGRQGEDIRAKESILDARQKEWEEFDNTKEIQALANAEKSSWIEEKLRAIRKTQSDLQAKIQAHANQKRQLEADRTKLDRLKATVDGLIDRIKENNSALELLQHQHANSLQQQEKASALLGEVKKTLDPYFIVSDWMDKWKSAPSAFLERIGTFSSKWKENTRRFEQNIGRQGVLTATIAELESQAKTLLDDTDKKNEVYSTQEKKYGELLQQRNIIFDGQDVQDIEKKLKQAIEEAQQQSDKHKSEQQQLNLEITRAITQKEQYIKEMKALETEMKTVSQKITDWLEDYKQKYSPPLSREELSELLSLSNDWVDVERKALQIIDEEVTKATSVLAERSQLLNAHKQIPTSERPLAEITELNTTVKSDVEQKKRAKSEIIFKLQQDETNKTRIGDLLKSIVTQAAVTENWSKLNDIIGSADGKKFRQIAQEYTLDVLLGYANIHLKVLTGRYRIQRIPTSLGLQVVDQDMGDEVRTVFSLSGGESFLVSLALALGLASLSSSRMKVESLFIDEGFGSLDPTTFNIAMDALERLHNQGRKVGVISHVQEMTERIPTQIQVSKMASGKSKVAVIGF